MEAYIINIEKKLDATMEQCKVNNPNSRKPPQGL